MGYQVHTIFKDGTEEYENVADEATAKKIVKMQRSRGAKFSEVMTFVGKGAKRTVNFNDGSRPVTPNPPKKGSTLDKAAHGDPESQSLLYERAVEIRKRALNLLKQATEDTREILALKATGSDQSEWHKVYTKAIAGDPDSQEIIRHIIQGAPVYETTKGVTGFKITKMSGLDQKSKDDEDEDAKDEADEDEDSRSESDEDSKSKSRSRSKSKSATTSTSTTSTSRSRAKDEEDEDEDEDSRSEEDEEARARDYARAYADARAESRESEASKAADDFTNRVSGGSGGGDSTLSRQTYSTSDNPFHPAQMPQVGNGPTFDTGSRPNADGGTAFRSGDYPSQVEEAYQRWIVNMKDGIHAAREIGLSPEDMETMHLRRTAKAVPLQWPGQGTDPRAASGGSQGNSAFDVLTPINNPSPQRNGNF